MTTIMQPFQCDLQPPIQETHKTTHTGTTTRFRTQRGNPLRPERPQPQPPHTRGTFHPGCSHFARKNARLCAPASSPKQSPCNIHAAITIRFAASRSKPASLYAHGNTRWQQSCSHSNAICNHRFKKRIELRTQEQPLVAEHRTRNQFAHETAAAATGTHEVPVIGGRRHCRQKNTRFRAPASSPKPAPCKATSQRHQFPSSPLPFVTTLCHSLFLFCDVKSHTTLHWVYWHVMYCYAM